MKHKLITITALAAALSTLASCRQEEAPSGLNGPLDISLEIAESPLTKVDVDGNSGACTWTSGDQIGIFVVNESEGNAYHPVTVNTTSNTVHLAMTPEMSLSGYSVTPYLMCDDTDPAPTGATPRVHYLKEYSMSGKDLTSQTFSNVPMMAVNNAEVLRFYHVGGLLRLVLSHVPENTDKIAVEFVGMTHVCGRCTVTNPGTSKATTAITTGEGNGEGNVITFTNVTRSAETMYLNVPLPSINFSALTAVRIQCFDSGNHSLGLVSMSANGSWGLIKHGYGRILSADFAADLLSGVRLSSDAAVTLWKSKTVQRTATALDQYGLPYADATVVWTSSDTDVATVDANTGFVTAKRAVNYGYTTITATATPNIGGTPYSASYRVYVNEVTGVSIEPTSVTVSKNAKYRLAATITHTNYGTALGFPFTVSFSSENTNYIRINTATTTGSVAVNPEYSTETTFTTSAEAYGYQYGGPYNVSVTVPAAVSYTGSAIAAACAVTCDDPTTISSNLGTFSGYRIAPGYVQYSGGTYSVPDSELDGLASIMAAYNNSRSKHYFTWNSISSRTFSNSTSSAWRVPTQSEWNTILNTAPASPIVVGGTTLTRRYYNIVVNLDGSVLDNKGITTSSMTSGSSTDYILGLLVIPDGATIACSRLNGNYNSTPSTSTNCITYSDLKILVEGGCVFIAKAGTYINNKFSGGGQYAYYWTATTSTNGSELAYFMSMSNVTPTVTSNYPKSDCYLTVRAIR